TIDTKSPPSIIPSADKQTADFVRSIWQSHGRLPGLKRIGRCQLNRLRALARPPEREQRDHPTNRRGEMVIEAVRGAERPNQTRSKRLRLVPAVEPATGPAVADVLAALGHELRAPLACLRATLELLAEESATGPLVARLES